MAETPQTTTQPPPTHDTVPDTTRTAPEALPGKQEIPAPFTLRSTPGSK